VIAAFVIPDLVDLLVASFTALLILAPTTFALLFSKRPDADAAFYSITFGFIVFIGLIRFMPKEAFVAGTLVSILTYLLVRRIHRKDRVHR
jgi:Na+/proline symporter